MLTTDKVNAARAEQERRGIRTFAAIGAAVIAIPIELILIYRATALGALDLHSAGPAIRFMLLAPWGAIIGLALIQQFYRQAQGRRDPRLRCPHCDRSFRDGASLVVATQNCTHCGRRILAGPAAIPPDLEARTASPLTAEKFNEGLANVGRRTERILLGAPLIGLAAGVACYAATAPFRPQIDAAFTFAYYSEPKDSISAVSLFAGGAVFCVGFFVAMSGRGNSRGMRCQHCGQPIGHHVQLVTATRHCPHCSRRILADPPDIAAAPPEPSGPPFGLGDGPAATRTIEKFNDELADRARQSSQSMRKAGLIGLAVGIVGYPAAAALRYSFGHGSENIILPIYALVCIYTPMIAFAVLLRGNGWRIDCQHCGEQIGGRARFVIATRNCPHCGRRVVAEPAPLTAGPPGDAPGSASRSIGAPTAT